MGSQTRRPISNHANGVDAPLVGMGLPIHTCKSNAEKYKMICNGRYGTYDRKWVDLGGDHHKDYRVINCVSECNIHLND